jgi:hypothetical protein
MKDFFKHDKGYLLINEEAFFLTSSGNWSEALSLSEKSISSRKVNNRRADRMYYFVGLLMVACFYAFYSKKILAGFGGMALLFFVWNYLKNETTARYKIPLQKIIQLNVSEPGKIQFRFYNEMGQEDTEYIQGVEHKGVAFLIENFNKFIES